jgi:hypothetical protein
MPVESPADRASFVSAAEFAEAVIWVAASSSVTASVPTIVQAGTLILETQDGPDILNSEATLTVVVEDLPSGAARGDQVQLRSIGHLVKAIEPDGTGFALVRLEEANVG